MWVDPNKEEKPGFVWCSIYHGWMSNNGFCNQDDTSKRNGQLQKRKYDVVIPSELMEDIKTYLRFGCDGTLLTNKELLCAINEYSYFHLPEHQRIDTVIRELEKEKFKQEVIIRSSKNKHNTETHTYIKNTFEYVIELLRTGGAK